MQIGRGNGGRKNKFLDEKGFYEVFKLHKVIHVY